MPKVGFKHTARSIAKMSASKRERSVPLLDRFWASVDKHGPVHPVCGRCWVWTAGTFTSGMGYGQIRVGGVPKVAHRVSWEIHGGRIPKGKLVLHRCDNPLCIRPSHLFLGTHQDNSDDKWAKGRAVVVRGEGHASSKLTEEEVKEIRRLYVRGRYGYKKLGKLFGRSPGTIVHVVRRETWRHI